MMETSSAGLFSLPSVLLPHYKSIKASPEALHALDTPDSGTERNIFTFNQSEVISENN